MEQTAAKLESHRWQPHRAEQQKIRRDGKWELNLYHPDLSWAKVREFQSMLAFP
jgi:hypothetical protein